LRRASDVVGRLDGAEVIVLSHASDEDGVNEFASRISTAVRELGLHHPRSTVSFRVAVCNASDEKGTATEIIDALVSGTAQ
jgi:GGDEF domain-containing protein